MDGDEEARKVKWLIRFGLGLIVTSFLAWGELTYAVFGKRADATVTKVEDAIGKYNKRVGTHVSYQFVDDTGANRTGEDGMSLDWQPPSGGHIPVVYRAGTDGASRLAGHVNWIGLTFWLVFFVPTAWVLGSWIKESVEYGRDKKRRAATEKRPYRY